MNITYSIYNIYTMGRISFNDNIIKINRLNGIIVYLGQ